MIKGINGNSYNAYAIIDELLVPSEHRVKSLCPIAYKCGGCDLRHIAYDYQLELKQKWVKETMKNVGGIDIEVKEAGYYFVDSSLGALCALHTAADKITVEEIKTLIHKLRSRMPDITLRSTFIVGFPGETEEQHEELMAFIDEMEFDRLGVFAYSPEEDTPAAEFAEQIEEEVKENRRDEIMELQQEIAFDKCNDMIGREVLVMIEGSVAGENAYVGRTYMDAPNVDGYIFVNTEEVLMSGDFAMVKVTGAIDYDLIGELC